MELPPSDDEPPLAELKQRRRSVSEKKMAPTSEARDAKKKSDDALPVVEQKHKRRKPAGKEEASDEAGGVKKKARGRPRTNHVDAGNIEKKARGRPRRTTEIALSDDLPKKNLSRRTQTERKVKRKGVVDEESDDDVDNYHAGEEDSKSVECEDDLHGPGEIANRKSPGYARLTKRQSKKQKVGRPRRKARQKSEDDSLDVNPSPQDVDGGEEEDGPDHTPGLQTTKRQTAGKRRRRASNKVVDDDAEENEEARDGHSSMASQAPEDVNSDDDMDDPNDPDHISDEEKATRNQKSRHSKRRRLDKKPRKKSENTRLTCPHCQKPMSSKAGLQYHLDKFVCRPDENPVADAERPKKRRGKKADSSGEKKCTNLRFRGSLEERTCHICKREFTSDTGMQYHAQHKVCQQADGTLHQPKQQFHVLSPGERFVTTYGIVEVVKDDRATPIAILPANTKALHEKWKKTASNQEKNRIKAYAKAAGAIRWRKNNVNRLYEKGALNTRSVFNAYFGEHPKDVKQPVHVWPNVKDLGPDPLLPTDAHADRIIECIWLPDTRTISFRTTDKVGTDIPMQENNSIRPKTPTKLYLRRQILTAPYKPEVPKIACEECGRRFDAYPGLKYHVDNKVCSKRAKMAAEARADLEERIAKASTTNVVLGTRNHRTKKKKMKRKKKEMGVYPEVVLSLGFILVKRDVEDSIDDTNDEEATAEALQDRVARDLHDALLANLKEKLVVQQREADDQKYGAMYAEVFKSLEFKVPKKRKGAYEYTRSRLRKRKRAKKIKPLPPPKPVPPIIDTRALADEVDSGRYPSMKRYKGEEHVDVCGLCKDGGDLICCDFCTNSVHLSCARKRYTIKAPEPEDDFMCHRCIGIVLQRRARAEKRRLEKNARAEERQKKAALEESIKNPEIEEGKEYNHLAQKGQEASELIELLQDARLRLLQSVETTKINNLRRRIMEF